MTSGLPTHNCIRRGHPTCFETPGALLNPGPYCNWPNDNAITRSLETPLISSGLQSSGGGPGPSALCPNKAGRLIYMVMGGAGGGRVTVQTAQKQWPGSACF